MKTMQKRDAWWNEVPRQFYYRQRISMENWFNEIGSPYCLQSLNQTHIKMKIKVNENNLHRYAWTCTVL